MTTTMQLIAKQTVSSNSATSVVFSDIPQTYTDLKLIISGRLSHTQYGNPFILKPNGSSSNGSVTLVRAYDANGSQSYSINYLESTDNDLGDGATASTFTSTETYITNYSSNSKYKLFSSDSVNPTNSYLGRMEFNAGLWQSTSPITSLTIDSSISSLSFRGDSTFYLYGISNSTTTQNNSVPYASGGDVITTDGTYWYHTFLYSGTFTPLKNLTCDYLVVGGGGGGGAFYAAGGGAGGLRSTVTATGGGGSLETPLSLTANTAYTAQIGSGGAGATTNSQATGFNGGNSIFATITSIGGGGGASENQPGANGGSGGGGSYTAQIGGTGTANQGYGGGTGSPNVASGRAAAGGGGGAGQAGANSPNYDNGGAGGNGVAVSITGSSVTYAGGGGGGIGFNSTGSRGLGGSGGGGNGGNASSQNGGNGTANLGAGGGGAFGNSVTGPIGGNGGSGIIVVRYAV